jgi:flagellar protein FliO/FliZ
MPRRLLGDGIVRAALAAAVLGFPAISAHAADAVSPSPVSLSALLQVVFGLALVVAAIVATGWLLRRIGPAQSAGGLLRVIGGVMVGPRERLVLVELGEQWLVLGVASGSVNLLHTLPKPQGGTVPRSGEGTGYTLDPNWLKRLLAGSGTPR